MISSVLLVVAMAATGPSDAKLVDLGDGYVRVETSAYSLEMPAGWAVSEETPWGARKAEPKAKSGNLGVMTAGGNLGAMTAPPTRETWDGLYRTSLYFIMRERGGKATPYELTKTESGIPAMVFQVKNDSGFAARRYVMLRNPDGRLLALSVDIPNEDVEPIWQRHFDRMVRTARFVEAS